MKISVIIPVYNAEMYLNKCLESLLNQEYINFEVIMIDDGSIDNSKEICQKFQVIDSRFILISTPNNGVSSARNTGLSVATGEYVYFLDSDDYLDSKTLLKFASRLNDYPDMIIGKLTSVINGMVINSDFRFKWTILNIDIELKPEEKFELFFGRNFGANAGNKLIKRSLIVENDISFSSNLFLGEDFLFNLEIFLVSSKITFVNDASYFYNINENSVSKKPKSGLVMNYFSLFELFKNKTITLNKTSKHLDLLAFLSFTVIDNSCTMTYKFEKNRFKGIKLIIQKFSLENEIMSYLSQLSTLKFTKRVVRKDWVFFALVFSTMMKYGLVNLSSILIYLRCYIQYNILKKT